ncbi:MAG: Alcohol dehydrogenase GroES domain protein [Blastococcus sp.]|nr:Alcohol dehydrogenase GroES domain protein [Blastococcus sp.]
MTETMQALVKGGPGQAGTSLREVPLPVPARGQVRLRVRGTGICGTDLHIMDDEYPSIPPVVMGHEVTGIVDAVGADVSTDAIGRRVSLETYYVTCGSCDYCRGGSPNLCATRRSIGSHVDGGFAEHVVVPLHNAHDVDPSVGEAAGALYEPLACVAHALCDPAVASPGDTALVVGPGAMGLLAAQVLAAQGARVTVVGTARDALRLAAADALGLTALESGDLTAPGAGFDVVADCSGAAAGIDTALTAVRKGGHYVQIGLCGKPVPIAIDVVTLHELTVTSGFASTPRSWRRAERLVGARLVRLDPLLSDVLPLSAWEKAVTRTRAGDGVKFVLEPGA